jgi:hypothetical protein
MSPILSLARRFELFIPQHLLHDYDRLKAFQFRKGTIEYDQKLTSADAIMFPMGGGISKYEESVQDNKVVSYFDFPSIRPNEPLTVVVHGAGEKPLLVKKVTLRTKAGASPLLVIGSTGK